MQYYSLYGRYWFLHQHTTRRGRNHRMSRMRIFLWRQSPYITTKYLREMLYLILTENSFQFCGSSYLQTHRTSMGSKMAVALHGQNRKTNIKSELHQTAFLEKYIDDVFSLWNTSLDKIESYVKKAITFTLQ